MDKTVLISIPVEELETIIIDCVNSCLKYSQPRENLQSNIDSWLSLDDLCSYLPGNPAKATIYAKVHNRQIPHKKMGGRLAFLKSEIDAWLKSKGRKTIQEIEAEVDNQLSKQ